MRHDLSHKEWVEQTFEGERWKRGWDDAAGGLIAVFFVALYLYFHWPF